MSSRRARLSFRQRGERVLGTYQGGRISRGCLVGKLAGARLSFRYVQAEASGEIHGGTSTCDIVELPGARICLVERFTWRTREGAGGNVFDEDQDGFVRRS